MIIPANRFEIFEALAAKLNLDSAILDEFELPPGGFDVLAQHIVGRGCRRTI